MKALYALVILLNFSWAMAGQMNCDVYKENQRTWNSQKNTSIVQLTERGTSELDQESFGRLSLSPSLHIEVSRVSNPAQVANLIKVVRGDEVLESISADEQPVSLRIAQIKKQIRYTVICQFKN